MPGRNYTLENYRFGYQGAFAEEDPETGYTAFDLRLYDKRIGRWLTTDPYKQHWSSYLGMSNNPANVFDADGGWDSKFVARLNRWGAKMTGKDPGALYQSGNDWGFNTWDGADGVTFNFKDYGNGQAANILWNSDFMRSKIPDRITLGVPDLSVAVGLGANFSHEINIITRGHEAGIFRTTTIGQRAGLEGDAGLSLGVSSYNGPVSELTRSTVAGTSYDLDGGLGIGGNINVALNPDNNKISWIGVKASLGMTIGLSVGKSNRTIHK